MGALKWIGGVAGWALGGPLGGILGFFVGKMFEGMNSGEYAIDNETRQYTSQKRAQTHEGDFGISLLVLSAAVMKADKSMKRSELDYVKAFFRQQFGEAKAAQYILVFKEILQQDINLMEVCGQIRYHMDHASRLQLLHYLFGLSQSDGHVCQEEISTLQSIASFLGISRADFDSIKAMFVKDSLSAYKILEIDPTASNEEVKKAYKKMAIKYHPDKVSHLGEDVQRQANEKFQQVNAAYEQIKKERGMN